MKIFEVLSFNRELLARLSAAGVRLGDYKYLDLYNDYKQMVAQGEKVTYVVTVMAERYSISERQVYKVIHRMEATATLVQ